MGVSNRMQRTPRLRLGCMLGITGAGVGGKFGGYATRMDSLLIEFRDNGTAHDDLHRSLDGYARTTDSYYLAIDPSMLPHQESADKVRRVLIRLLQRWTEVLSQATPTQPVYLPFDFSDQYTGCLSCRPDGEFVEIVPGTSSREGWNVGPSDPGDYFFGITDFCPDAPAPVRLSREEFLRRIRESIADTESQLSKSHDSLH